MNEYPINPNCPNIQVSACVTQLRKDGFSASWLDGVLRTDATIGQIAWACGNALQVLAKSVFKA